MHFQFKRAPGPKNRRNPSRSIRRTNVNATEDGHSVDNGSSEVEVIDFHATNSCVTTDDTRCQPTNSASGHTESGLKPCIGFLDIHNNNGSSGDLMLRKSPDHSPSSSSSNKPFVPPLDLSILHEHVEGGGKSVVI